MAKKILDVLYQSDDNYAMVSGISIASLLENNKILDKINIYYCEYNISSKNRTRLKELVEKYNNAQLIFIDGEGYHKKLEKIGVKPWHGVYVTWLKLLAFGDIKSQSGRIVFINGHTIINGPLDYFINYDFKDNYMALGYDCLTSEHKKTIGLDKKDGYYNCGIMLINLDEWIDSKLSSNIIKHLKKKNDYTIADQDLCNVMFKDKIGLLDCSYNFPSSFYAYDIKSLLKINQLTPECFYSYDSIMESYYSPKIIHSLFGIKGKPWEKGNDHPNRHLWAKYLSLTPWKDQPMNQATRTFNWWLYDILPKTIFMALYSWRVKSKFGK